jgi:hypothetical protein
MHMSYALMLKKNKKYQCKCIDVNGIFYSKLYNNREYILIICFNFNWNDF